MTIQGIGLSRSKFRKKSRISLFAPPRKCVRGIWVSSVLGLIFCWRRINAATRRRSTEINVRTSLWNPTGCRQATHGIRFVEILSACARLPMWLDYGRPELTQSKKTCGFSPLSRLQSDGEAPKLAGLRSRQWCNYEGLGEWALNRPRPCLSNNKGGPSRSPSRY
jgi:hypothetical protein